MLMQNNANGSAGVKWLSKPSDSGMNQPTKYHLKYMSKDGAQCLHHFTRLSALLTIALAVPVTSAAASFSPLERVAAVSRSTDTLDVFAADGGGILFHARWDPSGGWQGWSNISQGESKYVASGTGIGPVTAVSTATGEVDVFTAAPDNYVYTARTWDPNCCYAGWSQIGNLLVDTGSYVSAVSRSNYKFDIFVASYGQVWTAAYDLSNGLRGWWSVPGPGAPKGCGIQVFNEIPVAAASPVTDELDIFAVDVNGNLQASSWAPYLGGWTCWRPIGGVRLSPGAPVTAISRAYGQLELFVTDVNGNIQTTTVLPSFSGWKPIGIAAPGAMVTGVSRRPGWLDIFVVEHQKVITQGSPSPSSFNSNNWRVISGLTTRNEAAVAAVSRSQDHLDVFVIGFDGTLWTGAWEPDFVQPGVSDWHVFQVPVPYSPPPTGLP